MVEELLQARDPSPFERFFFWSVLSSVLVTSALHANHVWGWNQRGPFRHAVKRQAAEIECFCTTIWVDVKLPGPDVPPPRVIVRAAAAVSMKDDLLSGADVPVYAAPWVTYPEMLIRAGIAGRVVVRARIDTLGNVEQGSTAVIRGRHPVLDTLAVRTVLKTRFYQARIDRVAGEAVVEVPVDFILPD